MSVVTLNVVEDDAHDGIPLLSFPQGIPSNANEMTITMFQQGENKKRKREVVGHLHDLKYMGKDYKQYSAKHDTCHYAIGIIDEKTHVMNVYAATHPYIMQPVFEDRKSELKQDATYSERLRASTEAFGSKKKKKALKAYDSNQISAENIVGVESLGKSLKQEKETVLESVATVQSAAVEALEAHRRKLLPPYNTTATTVEEAYPPSGLVPADLQALLMKYYEAKVYNPKSGKLWRDHSWYSGCSCPFTLQLATSLHQRHMKLSEEYNSAAARILMLNALIEVFRQLEEVKFEGVRRKELMLVTSYHYPSKVVDHILANFSATKANGRMHYMEKENRYCLSLIFAYS